MATVLRTGQIKNPFSGACTRNVWLTAAQAGVELQHTHVFGEKNNSTADLLSRWQNSVSNVIELGSLVQVPVWVPIETQYVE